MNRPWVRAAAFGIGTVAGLRTLLAPAVVAWTAHKRVINRQFPLAALASSPAANKMMKLAAEELLADKLSGTHARISPRPLATRAMSGAACGAAVSWLCKEPVKGGALLGGAGALAGAFAGYYARKSLTRNHSELGVACAEDALALVMAVLIMHRVTRQH
jgi:uncharacterized membrane protein